MGLEALCCVISTHPRVGSVLQLTEVGGRRLARRAGSSIEPLASSRGRCLGGSWGFRGLLG